MIIDDKQVEVTENFQFAKVVDMTFVSEEAIAMAVNSQIQMYTNPYEAALREYSSNALDATRDAGSDAPVEISLPSQLSPSLIIEDHGTGMSRSELESYGQFGESTRRKTNDFVGGWGVGSKSGLAVASQFTVSSVKDGLKNTIVIGRKESGAPFMGFMEADSIPTDQPNGTKVSIPSSDFQRFQRAVDNHLYLGWKPGSILVNGEEPEHSIHHDAKFKPLGTAGWTVVDPSLKNVFAHQTTGRAVVGPVTYQINWSQVGPAISLSLLRGFLSNSIVNLDNGSVDLLRSRENLIYSARTRDAITSRVRELVKHGQVEFLERIDKAQSVREAMKLISEAENFGFNGPFTYQGKEVKYPKRDEFPDASITSTTTKLNYDGRWLSSRETRTTRTFFSSHIESFAVAADRSILVVESAAPKTNETTGRTMHPFAMSSLTLARALAFRDTLENPGGTNISYVDASLASLNPWFSGAFSEVITEAEAKVLVSAYRKEQSRIYRSTVKPVKPDPVKKVRVLNFRDYGRSGYSEVNLTDLDKSVNYILLQRSDNEKSLSDRALNTLTVQRRYRENRGLAFLLTQLVRLSQDGVLPDGTSTKVTKYKILLATKSMKTEEYRKVLPHIFDLKTVIEAEVKASLINKSGLELRAEHDVESANYSWVNQFSTADIDAVKNPVTREWMFKILKTDTNSSKLRQYAEAIAAEYQIDVNLPQNSAPVPLMESPGRRYPLIRYMSGVSRITREVVEYINLIDAEIERKEQDAVDNSALEAVK